MSDSQRDIPETEREANIVSYGNYPLVSNFARTRFEFQGKRFASIEAFIQYIKYPENHPERKNVAKLSGKEAKKAVIREIREEINRQLLAGETPTIHWNGEKIDYRSSEHYALIEDALRAKFEQNPEAYKQLMATGNKKLIHDTGKEEKSQTFLPNAEFVRILTQLRQEFR